MSFNDPQTPEQPAVDPEPQPAQPEAPSAAEQTPAAPAVAESTASEQAGGDQSAETAGDQSPDQSAQADAHTTAAPLSPPVGASGPGWSPAASDPNLVSESPETSPNVQAQPSGPAPPPANAPGAEATGPQPVNLDNPAAVTCPVCQHRFVPGEEQPQQQPTEAPSTPEPTTNEPPAA